MSHEPLYPRTLGEAFGHLPPAVRSLHALDAAARWDGRADVLRGPHPLARLLAVAFGLPPEGPDQPLSVTFTPDADGEIWERRFGLRVFRSRQAPGRAGLGTIDEAIGPAVLTLVPAVDTRGLTLSARGMRLAGLPVPGLLVPRVATREWEEAGRYRFAVEARIAGLGLLVAYRGWLEPAAPGSSSPDG